MAEHGEHRKPQVFVSYGAPDQEHARSLVEALSKLGIRARFDQLEVRSGDNVVLWMNDAVAESDYLLLLLSRETVERYWVRMEWSAAMAKEAELRRTFLIPVVLPGTSDSDIPALIKPKSYVDLRHDAEEALLKLVNRFKGDAVIARDLGSYPIPAPAAIEDRCAVEFTDDANVISVFVHSNRFSRVMHMRVPTSAGAGLVLATLREELGLPYSLVDESLKLELSYEYFLRFRGQPMTTAPLAEQGVTDGARLELWIRIVWRDLVQNRTLSERTLFALHHMSLVTRLDPDANLGSTGRLAEGRIANRACSSFDHVDE